MSTVRCIVVGDRDGQTDEGIHVKSRGSRAADDAGSSVKSNK